MLRRFNKTLVRTIRRSQPRKPLLAPKRDVSVLRSLRGVGRPRVSQFRQFSRVLTPAERVAYRTALVFFVIGVFWFSAAMLRGYRTLVPAVGGTYHEAIVGEPELINPLFSSLNDVDQDIVRLVYSGLMRYDSEQRLVPDLAAKVDVSTDKLTYTATLREDVLWHDGESFTAEDVVFTFESIQNEEIGSPLYVAFQQVSVVALNKYLVEFTLDEPFAPFLQSLTVGVLPEHEWFDVLPERFPLTQKNLQPVGTGPFAFNKLSKDASGYVYEYALKRNEAYYRQVPYIEDFFFTFYRAYDGETGAIQDLRQQAVEALHFVPIDLREKVERKHLALHTLQLPQYTALFFNQEREPALADDEVREALSLALNKDRILREALAGEGRTIESPILPGFPGFDPDKGAPFDITAANELLDEEWASISTEEYRALRESELIDQLIAEKESEQSAAAALVEESTDTTTEGDTDADTNDETTEVVESEPVEEITSSTVRAEVEQILAGEIDPSQTMYRQKDDIILELDIVTVDIQEYRDAAKIIEAAWQEIGITVNVAYVSAKDLSRTVLKDRSYDVLLYGVIVGADPDQYPFWHSSQVAAPGLNLAQFESSKLDTLLESTRAQTDETKLTELYTEIQEIICEARPAIFLYMPTYTYVQTTDLLGFDAERIFVPSDRFNGVTDWYLKTKGVWSSSLDTK